MMRSCRTCRWFRPNPDERAGRCVNPDIEAELGLQLAVRAKELHCRRGWNDDHWSAAPDDIVLEVRFKSPGQNGDDSGRTSVASERTIELRSVESIVSAWGAPVEAGTNPDAPRP